MTNGPWPRKATARPQQPGEPLDALAAAYHHRDAPGFQAHVRRRRGDQAAGDPLGDHRRPGAGADARLGQGEAGELALRLDPHLAHLELAPQLLDAGHPRADPRAGAGGQGRPQDVTRGVHRRGAGEHHRLAVEGLLDQRQHVAAEPGLAGGEDHRGVLVVGAVGDQRPRAGETGRGQAAVLEAAEDHPLAAVEETAGHRLVVLEDHRLEAGPLGLVHQGGHRRAVAVDEDVALELRRLYRQPRLEALFQERDQVDREDQEDEEDADELDDDDEHHHQRMAPAGVGAVAGGGERLAGPLEGVPEAPRLALEGGHPGHVDDGRGEQQAGHREEEPDQALLRAGHRPAPRAASRSKWASRWRRSRR